MKNEHSCEERGAEGPRRTYLNLDETLQVLKSFEAEKVEYVLVGGVAVNLHGVIRATEDVDLFLRPTAENLERLRRALHAVYADPQIEEISTADLLGDYPAVRYYPPTGDVYFDFLTRLGEFATYEDLEFEVVERAGVKIRVATPRTLYWLKRGTIRGIDQMDAERLREHFQLAEAGERPKGRKD
jgi:hypothetical protein